MFLFVKEIEYLFVTDSSKENQEKKTNLKLEKHNIMTHIDCFLSDSFSIKIELRAQKWVHIHLYHLTAVIFNDLSFVPLKLLR